MVSAFKIKDGHVDFKQAFVRTDKYVKEAEARRALLGMVYKHWKGFVRDTLYLQADQESTETSTPTQ